MVRRQLNFWQVCCLFVSKRFLVYSIFLSVPDRIVALGTFPFPQREFLNVTNSIDTASSIFSTSSVVLTIFEVEFGGQLSIGKIRFVDRRL